MPVCGLRDAFTRRSAQDALGLQEMADIEL
jgi:hypothetical protein